MSSAIEVFREQREAADQVHARLTEISALLNQLRHQINGLALNDELRAVLRQEQRWLERAEVVLSQLRSFREQDALRFWPGVVRRWIVALALALGSAAAAGASYGWATKPYAEELKALRTRMEFVSSSAAWSRAPAERRRSTLMKWRATEGDDVTDSTSAPLARVVRRAAHR